MDVRGDPPSGQMLNVFPDLSTGPVVKAFPDLEVGRMVKLDSEGVAAVARGGDDLGLVILPAPRGEEGLRVGSILPRSESLEVAVVNTPEALGALEVTVVQDAKGEMVVTITGVQPAGDD